MTRVKRILAIEDFGLVDGLPQLTVKPVETGLLDNQVTDLLDSLQGHQEAAVAIEAIAHTLQKDGSGSYNKTALKLANLAYGAFAEKAGVSLEELPIDVAKFDADPKIVVEQGIANIQDSKQKVFDQIRTGLSELLVMNARKREALQTKVKELRANWHALDESISRGLRPNEGGSYQIADRSDNYMLLYSGRIVDNGATVMPDICHFLTEHSHLFKRLIKKQTDWLADHKQNVLRTTKGFDSYTFNPIEYVCHGASAVVDKEELTRLGTVENEVVYKSAQLPGMFAFYSFTEAESCSGIEAVGALNRARTNIADSNPVERATVEAARFGGTDTEQFPLLTIEEIQARLAETKRAIDALEHWGQIAFIDIWKEACFEEEVLASIIRTDAQGLNERLLGELGFAVLRQLEEASNGVVGYVTHVLDAMLVFLSLNLENKNA